MNESGGETSIVRYAAAGVVLVIAAWILLHFVLGLLSFLFSGLILVVAVVAVVWALKTLL